MKKDHVRTEEQREAARCAARRWRAAHPELARARGREWYRKNRQRERKKQKAKLVAKLISDPDAKKRADRASYLKHHESRLRRQREYYRQHRDERILAQTCRRYGITLEQYHALGTCCHICGATKNNSKYRMHVDHCHETNRVRGLLCHGCNLGLGGFRNNPELLRKASAYLEERK